jgi:hypothetical protein
VFFFSIKKKKKKNKKSNPGTSPAAAKAWPLLGILLQTKKIILKTDPSRLSAGRPDCRLSKKKHKEKTVPPTAWVVSRASHATAPLGG